MSTSGKTVAIIQSSYIPWKGYFDVIDRVDEFIVLDDVQFSRGTWRNRNLIKTPDGPKWITIPVPRPHASVRIDEVVVEDTRWRSKHWKMITHNYSRAPFFSDLRERFEELYLGRDDARLSEINRAFIGAACDLLEIRTPIRDSTEYGASGESSERVVDLCVRAGATRYLSGLAARSYLDVSLFASAGIEVVWMDYSGYPEYPQLYPPFEHQVTVLDLIFNTGPGAPRYMRPAGGTA